jgi:serine/threonine protein kinase
VAELPIIEGFTLVEELGSGTLSSVYAAFEETTGRKVAVKILRGTISPSSPFAQQLEREARVLAALCHPNIGLLYAFARTEVRMYLVLEYVDGFSLAMVLKKKSTPGRRSAPRWRAAWRMPTSGRSSTVTSSPRTCSSAAGAR